MVVCHCAILFYFKYFILFYCILFFGSVGSSLLHSGFFQLWQVGATLGCSARASHCSGFSCCGARALEHRLSSCGARGQLLRGMWDLPGPGLEPVSPALAGGFLTTAPLGKSHCAILDRAEFHILTALASLPIRRKEPCHELQSKFEGQFPVACTGHQNYWFFLCLIYFERLWFLKSIPIIYCLWLSPLLF